MQDVTTAELQQLIEKNDSIILLEIYTEWCAPCKVLQEKIEMISSDFKDDVVFCKMDAAKNTEYCNSLNINSVPYLVLYRDKAISWYNKGEIEIEDIKGIIYDELAYLHMLNSKEETKEEVKEKPPISKSTKIAGSKLESSNIHPEHEFDVFGKKKW